MRRALLAPLLLAAGMCAAQARDALGELDSCIDRLDRGLDIGYARIAARCPELTPTLLASPFAPWLPADWNKPDNQLSAQGLSELRELLSRESAPAGARVLHTERVASVLKHIAEPPPQRQAWWARLKQWLRGMLAPQAEESPGWLHRLFGDVTLERAMLQAIVWGALALVIALAMAVVVNELRVAGLLRRRVRTRHAVLGADGRPSALSLEALERAGPDAQPALLFEFIAARLAAQERLPPARALTAQELLRRARLSDEADRARLAALAMVCERLRFSGRSVPPQVVAGAVAQGRALLAALDAPAVLAGAG